MHGSFVWLWENWQFVFCSLALWLVVRSLSRLSARIEAVEDAFLEWERRSLGLKPKEATK